MTALISNRFLVEYSFSLGASTFLIVEHAKKRKCKLDATPVSIISLPFAMSTSVSTLLSSILACNSARDDLCTPVRLG
jgi:hypothetical protein